MGDEWAIVKSKTDKRQEAILQAQQALQQQRRELKKSKKAKAKQEQLAGMQATNVSVVAEEPAAETTVEQLHFIGNGEQFVDVDDDNGQSDAPAEESEPVEATAAVTATAAAAAAAPTKAGGGSWAAIASTKISGSAPAKVRPTIIKIDDDGSGSSAAKKAEASTAAVAGLSHFLSSSLSISEEPTPSSAAGTEQKKEIHSRILSHSGGNATQASLKSAEEDDGQGWISPENYRKYRAVGGNMTLGVDQTAATAVEDTPEAKVACITTDFSMQNVMLQMGLHVISVDGMMIKSVKQWVLRCMACYTIHYDMDRLFCSRCGAHHMSRVGASIDARTGELRLHLKKNYRVDKSGQKFSLPAPGSRGRYEGELLLREDQLLSGIWRQKTVKIRKDVASHFGEDLTSDLGIHVNKGAAIVVGVGKKNPNAAKGRERRGKKASHSVFGY